MAEREGSPHVFVVAQKVARRVQQIVEVEKCGGALVFVEAFDRRRHLSDQAVEHAGRHGLQEPVPSAAASLVETGRHGAEALAIGLRQSRALCGLDPFALALVLVELALLREEVVVGTGGHQSNEACGIL